MVLNTPPDNHNLPGDSDHGDDNQIPPDYEEQGELPGSHGPHEQVSGTMDQGGDSDEQSDTDSIASSAADQRESDTLIFSDRLALVWKFMQHQLPPRTVKKPAMQRSRSLLTQAQQEPEQLVNDLPMSGLIRSSFTMWTERASTGANNNAQKALPAGKLPKIGRCSKFIRTSSDDFGHDRPVISEEVMREMRLKDKPSLDITLNETAANTLESQARRGVLAANLKEWLLGTLGHIMNLIKSHLMEVDLGKSMINMKDAIAGLNTCSELLESIGKASELEADALTYMVHAQLLTLLRRDTVIRQISTISDSLRDRLRHAPIIQESETLAQTQGNKANLLFKGMGSEIKTDRDTTTQLQMQKIILASTKPQVYQKDCFMIPKRPANKKLDIRPGSFRGFSQAPRQENPQSRYRGRGQDNSHNRGRSSSRRARGHYSAPRGGTSTNFK